MDWLALIPAELSPGFAAFLIGASFFTSAMTAAFGIGGGVVLMGLMSLAMPVVTLIPVHGMVQLGSNAGRAWTLRHAIDAKALLPFLLGGVAGATLASQVVISLPDNVLKAALGAFVIVITWLKVPRVPAITGGAMVAGGFITTALTLFLGATGPLVIALFAKRLAERMSLVATTAVAMVFQHAVKVIAFGLLGFAFGPWIALIIAMIITGYAGTLAGVGLLRRFDEQRFRGFIKIVLTMMGAAIIMRSAIA